MRFLFLIGGWLLLSGCHGPGAASSHFSTEPDAAHKLYVAKCAKCHKFYDPAKYSDDEWQVWMAKMSRKAKLTGEQQAMLSRYLDETFRTPQKSR